MHTGLAKLEVLYLGGTEVCCLPPEIGRLTQLRDLRITESKLSSLPPEIGQLTQLCNLSLHYNALHHLPSELGTILAPSETCPEPELSLSGNPMIDPPPEIMNAGTPAILAYLRDQSSYQLQQFMLRLIGGAGVVVIVCLGLYGWYAWRRKPKPKRKMG